VVVRLVAATVAGLAMLSGSFTAAGAAELGAAAERSAVGDGAALELTLTKLSPAAVGPDQPLVVSGTVRNPGTTTIKSAGISLWLRPEVLPDRAAIDTWLAEGELATTDRELQATARVKSLAAGATARFTLKVAPGETGLYSSSSFGPRAVALQVRTGDSQLAILRSTIVWAPTGVTTPTRLSLLVPITSSTPSTHAGQPTAEAAASLLSTGRLGHVLNAIQDPGISWVIDPAILTTAQRLSTKGIDRTPDDASLNDSASEDPDPPSPTSSAATGPQIQDATAKAAAQDWLALFDSQRRGRDVFALPYADPDLTAVLRSTKGVALLHSSDTLGKTATEDALGASISTAPISTTLAWPADGRANAATIRGLVKLKRTSVVLAGNSQQPDPKLDYTPTGRSTVSSSDRNLIGLVADQQLSSLISSSAKQTPAATQTLLAQLAAITMEQAGTDRHLLATLPRTWDPDPSAVKKMMHALGTAPWIRLSGVSELQEASGPPRGAPIYHKSAAKAELPPGTVSAAQVMDKSLSSFAPILVDQAPVQPLRERIASLLSVAWRGDGDDTSVARKDVADEVSGLVSSVRLGTSSSYIFTAQKNRIPVSVINDSPYEIRVVVYLKPLSVQLTIGDPKEKAKPITVGPGKTASIYLEAQAVSGGDVRVEGRLLGNTGVALGQVEQFTVRVRPNWESRAMIVVGSILGFLLVIGLLRSLRRNRTRARVPIEAVPDLDEAATQRAEAELAQSVAVGASSLRAGPWPNGYSTPGPIPDVDARTSRDPDPNPIADPVPIPLPEPALQESEPDPKVWGGPVTMDGVRPKVKTSPGR
jgi:hypothetical protein